VGSIGQVQSGFLAGGDELPKEGVGYKWRTAGDHHFGTPTLVNLVADSIRSVHHFYPFAPPIYVGELSAKGGGALLPKHASHRTGRDADILFYVTTLDGLPYPNDEFLIFGGDGLAFSRTGRFVRFDVSREWSLIRAIITNPYAHVQYVFISRPSPSASRPMS
jgi:penicillin-insensitive murein endopeptidase